MMHIAGWERTAQRSWNILPKHTLSLSLLRSGSHPLMSLASKFVVLFFFFLLHSQTGIRYLARDLRWAILILRIRGR